MASSVIIMLGWAVFLLFARYLALSSRQLHDDIPRLAELVIRAPAPDNDYLKPYFDIIVMVPSVIAWKDRRNFLRTQFVRNQNLTLARANLVFVVSGHDRAYKDVQDEVSVYDDFFFVDCPDLDVGEPEEGSSTTCKVLQGIQGLYQRYDFNYLARVGDDAYFRFDKFLQNVAPMLPAGPWYIGRFFGNNPVVQTHIQAHLGLATYPSYASGMGYVLSAPVTRYIAEASRILEFRTGFPEDAIVALWTLGTTTRRHDVPEFHNPPDDPYLARACDAESLLVHYMTPERWKAVDDKGVPWC